MVSSHCMPGLYQVSDVSIYNIAMQFTNHPPVLAILHLLGTQVMTSYVKRSHPPQDSTFSI